MLLKDKVVIVTGAGPGMGQAACKGAASEGAKVVVTARSKQAIDEIAALGMGHSKPLANPRRCLGLTFLNRLQGILHRPLVELPLTNEMLEHLLIGRLLVPSLQIQEHRGGWIQLNKIHEVTYLSGDKYEPVYFPTCKPPEQAIYKKAATLTRLEPVLISPLSGIKHSRSQISSLLFFSTPGATRNRGSNQSRK